ncbi:MAG: amidohydrolase family protein [Nocardioides sp.]|uniref:amidohydrolase family protein n=1 Tax=Nocardioides sp. TaxID=35761 RepID=UPI0039E43050
MTTTDLRRPSPRGAERPAAVTDVTVWTGSGWRAHTDVLLAGGLVGDLLDHDPARVWPEEVVSGRGGHLIPGFTNTHTHLQQSVLRGAGEGRPLLEWLLAIGEGMVATTPETAYVATVAGALEGLLGGTTLLVEHGWSHPDPAIWDAVRRGLDHVGVRAVLGVGWADRADATRRWGFEPRLMKPVEEVFDDLTGLMKATAGSRIAMAVAVANARTITPDGMALVRGFADDHGLPVTIHLSETGTDDAMCREHAGVDAVTYLERGGLLGGHLLAVHGVALSREAAARLASHGVGLSWNPVSNMRLGSGVAPVGEWRELGLAVGLGVDGPGSNDRQDMWETLRSGAYVQRAVQGRADVLPFAEMIALAVDGAAAVLGRPAARVPGAVEVGRPADLTLVRFDRDFGCLPVTDPGASMLTTGTPRIVDTVLVEGEVVVRDGRSTRIDVGALTEALLAL